MEPQTPPVKPWKLWAALFLIVALLFHVIVESAVRWVFAPRSGVAKYLAEFRAKAEKDGVSLQQYAMKSGLDPYLGWGGNEVRIHEATPGSARPRTLLFVGDSVTAGHDVRGGEEDYPALLAAKLGGQGIRVVNLAARGYGVDQMWLKLLTKASAYHPDMVVLAYIPHDLIRPASDFNFGLPKPRFRFDGSETRLGLAQGIVDYMEGYDSARSWFHLSGWYLSHYWSNREYQAPRLFQGYYRQLYLHIGEGLAKLSQEWGIPVRTVKLTNNYRFGGSETLIQIAEAGLARPTPWSKADVAHLDTDACVKAKAAPQSVDLATEFAHHPGPAGHRLLAECLEPSIKAGLGLP